jgi:DinB superfamily
MKLSHFAILTLIAPISLAAQQPSPGPPANPITASFRNRISGLHRNIAQAFDSIPQSKFGYKPTPAQLSIGYIAQHIASDDYFFCNNFGAMKGTRPADDTTTADSVKATWPKDKLVARLKDSFAFCDQAIAQLDDAKLGESVTITFGGNSRTVARAAMVLGHALDLADHYSQLANYMRLNTILPPTALPRPRPSGS